MASSDETARDTDVKFQNVRLGSLLQCLFTSSSLSKDVAEHVAVFKS